MTTPLTQNALPGILALEPYKPGMPLDELQRRLGITDAIKLASNENPLGPSPKVKQAIADMVSNGDLALYPDGGGFKLKAAIAAMHQIAPERITLGNGSNDLLEFLGRIYLGPGRAALFSQHAFAVYPIVTQAQNAQAIVVPALGRDHPTMPLGHDLAGFRAALASEAGKNVAMIFIANPNNPTGTWLPAAEIAAFLADVPAHIIVVLDEAYWEYLDADKRGDVRGWLDQFPNLVVTHTFSKTYGLASLRAGYGLSSPEVADLMNRVRQPFNNNSLALLAAEVALADQAHVRESVALNNRERERLQQALAAMGLRWLPSQANFLAIDFGRDAAPVHQALLQAGIIVRPTASYEMPSFLRVTIGTPAQNDRLIAALQHILAA